MKKPYLMVTGDFSRFGGMDWPNYALATHLADRGHLVHLVAFTAEEGLTSHPNVRFHPVPKPMGSYFLGFPWLARVGRHWASRVASCGGRVIVNGGNCPWNDIDWVHYIHAAYRNPRQSAWDRLTRGPLSRRRAKGAYSGEVPGDDSRHQSRGFDQAFWAAAREHQGDSPMELIRHGFVPLPPRNAWPPGIGWE